MDDGRIWEMEEQLWHGGEDVYQQLVDEEVVMALPAEPFIFSRQQAIDAVRNTPRWEQVRFSDQKVSRPAEGLIVIGYKVDASRGGASYRCYASSTLRRRGHDDWTVVQHSQVVPLKGLIRDGGRA
ncbi:DUF4440 domain-containing protein [Sphingomonas sp. GCM10030256]|uniref:DUF4440 domain-containing protein n=1 Tax=Sphingomonas sp. GCM10030256 TaxID=3273427 RepID=UPI0036147045